MADFTPTQQEIANVIDPLDNSFVLMDATNNLYKATVTSGGALLVTGSSGTFQVKDNDLAVLGTDLGSIIVGYDGTNYQFISVNANGELKIGTLPNVTLASQANPFTSAIPVSGTFWQATQPVSGTFWQATQPVSVASLPLPAGASTLAEQQTQTTSLQLLDNLPQLDGASDTGVYGVGVLGSTGSILKWLKVDASGSLQIAIQPSPNTYFSFGDIGTSVIATVPVRRTAYTEQTTNAQRSIASASANDTGAGTGAQQVNITYFDQTGAGPYTETLTLNGTTGVNTVASNICYIEKIEVIAVGSTGSNVGIITLYSTINKGGVAIGTIAATNNQTFWAHHYVATGMTMKVTGISCSHNGTTVGSGALFFLRSRVIGVAAAPEIQISDFVRLYGQSSTFSRAYNSPIAVVGPARVIMYVTPESASSFTYRTSFDYNEAAA